MYGYSDYGGEASRDSALLCSGFPRLSEALISDS